MNVELGGTLGERVQQARRDAALSQPELATMAQIKVGTLAAIEEGKTTPQPRTLRALAAALKVSPIFLRDGKAEPEFSLPAFPVDTALQVEPLAGSLRFLVREEMQPILGELAAILDSQATLHEELARLHGELSALRESVRRVTAIPKQR